MGNRFVFWGRRHSVARVNRPGDWVGLGSKTPNVVPFTGEAGGGSPDEPVRNGLGHDLARAVEPRAEGRKPGRPRKDEARK